MRPSVTAASKRAFARRLLAAAFLARRSPAVPALAAAIGGAGLMTPVLAAAQAAAPGADVVKLPDGVAQLQVDDQFVSLAPGSRGFRILPENTVTVLSGRIWAQLQDALVKADRGDKFLFHALGDRAQLVVGDGQLEITLADGSTRTLAPGQSLELSRTPAAVPPPPGVPQPPPSPAAGPAAPSTPAAPWDPLSALARSIEALASYEKPDLRLMLELHPFYRITQTYDSNIYLVPKDNPDGSRVGGGVLGSWITSHDLGAKLIVPFNRRHRLEGLYGLEWHSYYKQPKTNNAVNQKGNVSYAYSGIKDVAVRLWENYLNSEDPAFSELTARERRFQNAAGASLDSRRSRLFVWTVDAQHTAHKYLNPSLASSLNRWELLAGGSAGIMLQPKTRLYLAYHRHLIHYSAGRTSHSRSHLLDLGVDGRFTSKLSGKAQIGAQLRQYDVAVGAAGKVVNNLQTAIQVAFKPDGRNELNLRVSRDVNEATFGTNRYYTATGAQLSAAHTFYKTTLAVNGSYQVDRYPDTVTVAGLTRPRRDDLYGMGAGLDIKVRPWLSWGLGHQRLQRHSIFTGQFNYVDDRTSTNLRIAF